MKFVSLISSGIDSPVATYLFSKKSTKIILIHADGRPYTDDREIKNFINLVTHLKKQVKIKMKSIIIPHGENLNIYRKNCNIKYTCIFCKRMLLRYAEKILIQEEAEAIIMGDSLGQVASQTLFNLKVVDQSITSPVLRPLIGLDKEDIIKIAKRIGTYDISIKPSDGCRAVPSKPSTKAKIENILFEENKINVQKMVEEAVSKKEFI